MKTEFSFLGQLFLYSFLFCLQSLKQNWFQYPLNMSLGSLRNFRVERWMWSKETAGKNSLSLSKNTSQEFSPKHLLTNSWMINQTNTHTPAGHRLVFFSFRWKLAAVNPTFIRQPDERIWEHSEPAPSYEVILMLISSPGAETASMVIKENIFRLNVNYRGGIECVWPP